MRRCLLSFLLILPGCATPGDLDARLGSWRGATEDEVVRRWGLPAESRQGDLQRVLVFGRRLNKVNVLVTPGRGITGIEASGHSCKVTLILIDGTVRDGNWNGALGLCAQAIPERKNGLAH